MHIHILGLGGTFMAGLAALALQAGHRVTGCDTGVYPPMSDQLKALDIDVIEGYAADQLALRPDIFVVGNVVSRARLANGKPKFALMEAILNAGLAYTSGPQWLSEHILPGRHVLAVAGTHGKTTTSAMLAWILTQANLQPGFLIGGVPLNFGVSAQLGCGMPFVIEADEYDTAFFDKRSKFVHYRARTVILNNLEFDHADIFDDLAAIERQFHHLLRTVPANGRVIALDLQESLARVLHQGCYSELRSFGSPVADFSAHGPGHDFELLQRGRPYARLSWSLNGRHNQLNALAAIAAAEHLGVDAQTSAAILASFKNVKRRLEVRGTVHPNPARATDQIVVYDDFAHHCSAIRTTLDGLRSTLGNSERILALFEPRSNTMQLGSMKAMLPWSLESADLCFCYSAGISWDCQATLAPMGNKALVSNQLDQLIAAVASAARAGDHIVCMSNGNFDGVHAKLLAALQPKSAQSTPAQATDSCASDVPTSPAPNGWPTKFNRL